ncbi:MAG: hypothetical protein ACQGVC_24675 [Myxococcota bacterium]
MRRRSLVRCLPPLFVLLLSVAAGAESGFLLAYPETFGKVGAATYDDGGQRIGGADLLIERLDAGRVRMRSESGQQKGARTLATAEFATVGERLRVLVEESRSLDEKGQPLGVLTVDHVARKARCQDSAGGVVSEIDLPEADRVLNVPMNLFFLPLVSGEKDSLEFQLFLCRPDARLIDFVAWTGKRVDGRPLEIQYGPDFGFASSLARQMAPKLSFWFDREAPYPWVAHRLPLYSGGPEVFVVRDDIASTSLLD